jgi:oligopeptide/dipeptide ABC transporter ATP-binding protein
VPPSPDKPRRHGLLQGTPPSQTALPAGCALAGRCRHADARCRQETPALRQIGDGRQAACHKAEEIVRMPEA